MSGGRRRVARLNSDRRAVFVRGWVGSAAGRTGSGTYFGRGFRRPRVVAIQLSRDVRRHAVVTRRVPYCVTSFQTRRVVLLNCDAIPGCIRDFMLLLFDFVIFLLSCLLLYVILCPTTCFHVGLFKHGIYLYVICISVHVHPYVHVYIYIVLWQNFSIYMRLYLFLL